MSFHPAIGRWVQTDPEPYVDGLNLYEPGRSNPTRYLDPMGLAATEPSATQPATPVDSNPREGIKVIAEGTLEWSLRLDVGGGAHFQIKFSPSKDKCPHEHITFIQTVRTTVGEGAKQAPVYPGRPAGNEWEYYQSFDSAQGWRVDHLQGETDPYYGATWDAGGRKWAAERGSSIGIGSTGAAASMHDVPNVGDFARAGNGVFKKTYEVMAVDISTGKVLGGVAWGLTVEDKANSPVLLNGAGQADFLPGPTREWKEAVAQWNRVADKNNGWHKFILRE